MTIPPITNLVAVPVRSGERSAASDIAGTRLTGAQRDVRVVGAGRWTLLLFLASRCDGCRPLWAGWAAADGRSPFGLPAGGVTLAVARGRAVERPDELARVCAAAAASAAGCPPAATSEPAATPERAPAPAPAGSAGPAGVRTSRRPRVAGPAPTIGASLDDRLLLSEEAWRRYRVLGPPFFVLVDPDGTVATEGVAWAVEQVAGEVCRAVRRSVPGPRTSTNCRTAPGDTPLSHAFPARHGH